MLKLPHLVYGDDSTLLRSMFSNKIGNEFSRDGSEAREAYTVQWTSIRT